MVPGEFNNQFGIDRFDEAHVGHRCVQLFAGRQCCRYQAAKGEQGDVLAEHGLNVPLIRLGLPDRFIDHGEQGQLLAELGLDKEGIVRSVRARISQ